MINYRLKLSGMILLLKFVKITSKTIQAVQCLILLVNALSYLPEIRLK